MLAPNWLTTCGFRTCVIFVDIKYDFDTGFYSNYSLHSIVLMLDLKRLLITILQIDCKRSYINIHTCHLCTKSKRQAKELSIPCWLCCCNDCKFCCIFLFFWIWEIFCCLLFCLNRFKRGRTWKVSYFGTQSSENSSKGYCICCECFWYHHRPHLKMTEDIHTTFALYKDLIINKIKLIK